uniref:Uncharacterized protein n=1 Tax=Anguilla anguilla TaxID=7936 RepID=A0A0E9RLC5_ANGAN
MIRILVGTEVPCAQESSTFAHRETVLLPPEDKNDLDNNMCSPHKQSVF